MTAILITLCGCTRQIEIPQATPFFEVPVKTKGHMYERLLRNFETLSTEPVFKIRRFELVTSRGSIACYTEVPENAG